VQWERWRERVSVGDEVADRAVLGELAEIAAAKPERGGSSR